ncbi:type II toxin-antitoxin system HicA family toxin [Aggregatibacter actinomycetemcomitans]|uniref:type II toxin-antitoxin system HicA family toxin n=1 Tax=Aggregatibacter actinomycetemcomitans TaxID=714 RepID=UPI00022ACF6F|nr:type II toxin-antitoxin system HicA family toxin [Aggregatibacter actinomycetemcomitans]KOE57467.1 mRNA interferase [Aggregatibacter actinomycetemcomitans serotype c str. SCC2302]KOE59883.1 mRNA interferase [Aggregatibacter actinomycetemcomitans serotype c str. AAS4A]TYA31617.1 type II toxin-antitoxin system HicA family toxin [Aggregatibacter actinomycetemcomitans]
MKQSEFLRWLIAQGVTKEEGSKHIKLYYNGNQSAMPRQPSKEIKNGTVKAIKKQLGLN